MTDINGFTHSEGSVEFTIHEHLGILGENTSNGWRREVNIVSWNGSDPAIDIRDWSPDHTRMSRGVRLRDEEGKKLVKILRDYYISREERQRIKPSREDCER